MSIKLLTEELERFLGSTAPGVLCITGEWEVGKTYAWQAILRRQRAAGAIGLTKYSYVSLFGLDSLDDIRSAIVVRTRDSKAIDPALGAEGLIESSRQLVQRVGNYGDLLKRLPVIGSFVGNASQLAYEMVCDQIVCLDDLERRGPKLDVKGVLGLVSDLREQKRCKVVMLLNQDQLGEEAGKEFAANIEKVADVTMRFDPTPEEAASLGLDRGFALYEALRRDVVRLGVINIRVIKKAEAFSRQMHDALPGRDARMHEQAVHTLALAVFAKFQPDKAPPLDLILTFNSLSDLVLKHTRRESTRTPEEADPDSRHKAMLRNYGFTVVDQFDLVLIEGVERGFFDAETLEMQAGKVEEGLRRADKNQAFEQAWRLYHGSFADNADAVLDALVLGLKANYDAVTPLNLSETVVLLKELERPSEAEELIRFYVENRAEPAEFWDLNRPLGGHVGDPDVREAFGRKLAETKAPPSDPQDILARIWKQSGWNPDDVDALSRLSEDDYVALFKQLEGDDLEMAVRGGLFFREVGNADPAMLKLTALVEGALRRIAAESPLNARRVRKYGIAG